MLGVPFADFEKLTTINAVRTNGSSTAAEAANANKYVYILHGLLHLQPY